MKRTNIYISNKQYEYLQKLSKLTDIKPAELVRRALDHYMEYKPLPKDEKSS